MLSECQWKYLKYLDLSKNPIGNKGLKIMVNNGKWPNLQSLAIERMGLTRDGIYLLLKNPWTKL
jgi:hypothetical protein